MTWNVLLPIPESSTGFIWLSSPSFCIMWPQKATRFPTLSLYPPTHLYPPLQISWKDSPSSFFNHHCVDIYCMCINVCSLTCDHSHTHTHTHTCVCVCLCVLSLVYLLVCGKKKSVAKYMHTHIHIYIHTHTHTHTYTCTYVWMLFSWFRNNLCVADRYKEGRRYSTSKIRKKFPVSFLNTTDNSLKLKFWFNYY